MSIEIDFTKRSLDTIRLMAYLGHQRAIEIIGNKNSYQPIDFKEWVWGFYYWKRPLLVEICHIATELGLPIIINILDDALKSKKNEWRIEPYNSIVKTVKSCQEIMQRWLLYQDRCVEEEAKKLYLEISEIVEKVNFWVYEFGGEDETKTDYIVKSVMNGIAATIWNYQEIRKSLLVDDENELIARIIFGPAFETVQAVDYVRIALHISEATMRELLSKRLLDRLLAIKSNLQLIS